MPYTINFAEVEESELIPEGQHTVVITDVALKPSSAGDSSNLVWELTITSGPAQDRTIRSWTSLKPSALWRLKAILKNLGMYQEEMQFEVDESTGTVTYPNFTGLPAIAVISHSLYQNQKRAQVTDILPIDSTPTGNGKTSKGRKLV